MPNSLWVAHDYYDPQFIYELTRSGSFTSNSFQYGSTGDEIRGLDLDTNGCIWLTKSQGNESPDSLIQTNQSGSAIQSFTTPSTDARGVGIGRDDCIWQADAYLCESVYRWNQSGSIKASISIPTPAGVGVEPDNGSVWVHEYLLDSLHEVTTGGSIVRSFPTGDAEYGDIGIDNYESIWGMEHDGELRRYDQNMSFIDLLAVYGHAGPGISAGTEFSRILSENVKLRGRQR
jgi:streptogramin lyase